MHDGHVSTSAEARGVIAGGREDNGDEDGWVNANMREAQNENLSMSEDGWEMCEGLC